MQKVDTEQVHDLPAAVCGLQDEVESTFLPSVSSAPLLSIVLTRIVAAPIETVDDAVQEGNGQIREVGLVLARPRRRDPAQHRRHPFRPTGWCPAVVLDWYTVDWVSSDEA